MSDHDKCSVGRFHAGNTSCEHHLQFAPSQTMKKTIMTCCSILPLDDTKSDHPKLNPIARKRVFVGRELHYTTAWQCVCCSAIYSPYILSLSMQALSHLALLWIVFCGKWTLLNVGDLPHVLLRVAWNVVDEPPCARAGEHFGAPRNMIPLFLQP